MSRLLDRASRLSHVRTDPVCRFYRRPRFFEARSRGRECGLCIHLATTEALAGASEPTEPPTKPARRTDL